MGTLGGLKLDEIDAANLFLIFMIVQNVKSGVPLRPGVVAVTEVSSICFYVVFKIIFHAVITEISVFTPIVNNEQKLAP